ncbi:MAG: peptidylprolyl isomerase [Dysgonamonadaceae bacterium]|jgi:peptidyl-prolyl cis-trans isomerase B (cyclophilin B)|nr:peptidylprolyl isomerase [Dysgonamonadaceae bacterium]
MKTNFLFTVLFILFMTVSDQTNAQTYTIETTLGNIQIRLYENTPLHKANFERLIEEQVYDSVLFHRVIQHFMIQGGDPATKPANRNEIPLYEERETVPAEFLAENFHKKGALAAARTGDFVNPEKRSSPTQFYIVQGKTYADEELQYMEEFGGKSWTPEQKEIYKTIGGTPFLDMEYTVFGEVVTGLDIVDSIAAVPTQPGDRPVSDIRIIRIVKD